MMFKRYFRIFVKLLFVAFMISLGYNAYQTYRHDQAIKAAQLEEKKRIELIEKQQNQRIEKQNRTPAPPPPPEKDNKPIVVSSGAEIEVFSVLKVKLDDNDSWALVFKMLVLTLGTFFGIKFINFGFKKFE